MKKFSKAVKFCKAMSKGAIYHTCMAVLAVMLSPTFMRISGLDFDGMDVVSLVVTIAAVLFGSFVNVNIFAICILDFLECIVPRVSGLLAKMKGRKSLKVIE